MKKFKVVVNHYNMGIFSAEDERSALEAYAQEAGYESLADMEEQLGSEAEYDVVEVEADASDKQREEKKMKKFAVYANGFDMGTFEAEDEDAALEAYAQEAGYQSLADMHERLDSEKADDYEVVEV